MASARRPVVRRLGLVVACLLVLLLTREPVLSASPDGRVDDARIPRGLGLRPVLADEPGPCPSPPSPNVIWASSYDTCLTLSNHGLQIVTVRSAEVLRDGPAHWSVRLELDDPDALAFGRLTTELVSRPPPRNELAIILHGPPGGLVLAAPAVQRAAPPTSLDLDGGATETGARTLLASIVG